MFSGDLLPKESKACESCFKEDVFKIGHCIPNSVEHALEKEEAENILC